MQMTQTFVSSRIDALEQPPLSTAARYLHYVELAHPCFTLEGKDGRKRQALQDVHGIMTI